MFLLYTVYVYFILYFSEQSEFGEGSLMEEILTPKLTFTGMTGVF